MSTFRHLAVLALASVCAACATTGNTNSAAPAAQTAGEQEVPAEAIVGQPAPGSKFTQLTIGMDTQAVQQVMDRVPDRQHSYESGKRWIPFYFGNDARRMQVLYKGVGCLVFADGNAWGAGGGELIQIEHDASGACYQP